MVILEGAGIAFWAMPGQGGAPHIGRRMLSGSGRTVEGGGPPLLEVRTASAKAVSPLRSATAVQRGDWCWTGGFWWG